MRFGAQWLFRRLGLVPGPSFDGYAAAALDHTSLGDACRCLDALYDQHLLGEPAPAPEPARQTLLVHGAWPRTTSVAVMRCRQAPIRERGA